MFFYPAGGAGTNWRLHARQRSDGPGARTHGYLRMRVIRITIIISDIAEGCAALFLHRQEYRLHANVFSSCHPFIQSHIQMKLQPKQLSLLIAVALHTLSASVAAQSVSGSGEAILQTVEVIGTRASNSPYNKPNATSATRIDTPLRDVPQTVDVIPAQLMRDQAAQSLESVLRFVPGVGLSHGDGQRDQVTLRGFSAVSDQYIDGLRDDALYFRDLSNIEQVEVVKGPASVLYGRGSSGGLINRITKKPGINKSEITAQVGS